MQYGQIVLLITVGFIIYYIAMIVMDLQKANAAKAAEADNDNEEEIDISDEAKRFNPIKVSREEKSKPAETEKDNNTQEQQPSNTENAQNEQAAEKADEPKNEEIPKEEQAPVRPNLREPLMTDGIDTRRLIELIDKGAETGDFGLGALVMSCNNAKYEII